MEAYDITDKEFSQFQGMMRRMAGVHLSHTKKAMVCSRLTKRLRERRLESFGDYFELLEGGAEPDEIKIAVDLLTTHETYFFREPKHTDFLRGHVLKGWPAGRPFRVWSAACSTGEEVYTLAMVLADTLGEGAWEVFGSDISEHVLEKARAGLYPVERGKNISPQYLNAYCLKGVHSREGQFLIDAPLRQRVSFRQVNLCAPLPALGSFDVIFLRNVLIYFDTETKRQVVAKLLALLKPGGHFVVGHSETLNGIADGLKPVMPSVYLKP